MARWLSSAIHSNYAHIISGEIARMCVARPSIPLSNWPPFLLEYRLSSSAIPFQFGHISMRCPTTAVAGKVKCKSLTSRSLFTTFCEKKQVWEIKFSRCGCCCRSFNWRCEWSCLIAAGELQQILSSNRKYLF